MNRTDTLEAGSNQDIRLENISRAANTRSCVIEGKQNFFRRLKSFTNSVLNEPLNEVGWITSTVKSASPIETVTTTITGPNKFEKELNTCRKLVLND